MSERTEVSFDAALMMALRADAVVRVVCGIPVYYKGVEK